MSHPLSASIFSSDQWGWRSPSCQPHRECKMNLWQDLRCGKNWRSIKHVGLAWENKPCESAWVPTDSRLGGPKEPPSLCECQTEVSTFWDKLSIRQRRQGCCSLSGLYGHPAPWDINPLDSPVTSNLPQCLVFQLCPPFSSLLAIL